jgi:hypothetical protein
MLVHSKLLKIDFPPKIMISFLWLMTVLFLVNTLGNVRSKNKIEKLYFTPTTIVLTIFSLILVLENYCK